MADATSLNAQAIAFQQGLPGLGQNRKFVLYLVEDNPLFYYLQALNEPGLALILMDPFPCFPDYALTLTKQDKQEIALEQKEDVLVLTTVTVLGEGKLTTNLSAPIVINARRRLAKQVIIPERIGEMRTPLPFETAGKTGKQMDNP